jgi:hypothetical protein
VAHASRRRSACPLRRATRHLPRFAGEDSKADGPPPRSGEGGPCEAWWMGRAVIYPPTQRCQPRGNPRESFFEHTPHRGARILLWSLLYEGRCSDRPAMEKRAAPAPERVTTSSSRAGSSAARALGPASPVPPSACPNHRRGGWAGRALGRALTIAALGLALRMRTWNRRAGALREGPQHRLTYKPMARPSARPRTPQKRGQGLTQNPGAKAPRHG